MTAPSWPPSGTRFDVIVVGSGIAGLYTALQAHERGASVLVVTKGSIDEANTRYAQGGIAAAVGPDDSPEAHLQDTLEAGAGLVDEVAARVLTSEAADRIADLVRYGVHFDATDGEVSLGREAAHSAARILHARGDATGLEIELSLAGLAQREGVTVIEHTLGDHVVVEGGRVGRPRYVRLAARAARTLRGVSGRAGDRRRGADVPLHDEPARRDRRRHRAGVPLRRRGHGPRVHAVPPDGAAAARRARSSSSRRPSGARARCCSTPPASASCRSTTRWPSWLRATWWRAPPGARWPHRRGPRAPRHHRPVGVVARRALPADLPHVHGRGPRHEPRAHPGVARRALHDGRRPHEHLGRDDRPRPVRRGRGGLHRRPRREPPRQQLPPRDRRLRQARRRAAVRRARWRTAA